MGCLDICRDFLATASCSESERQQSFADLMGLSQNALQDIGGNPKMAGTDLGDLAGRFDAVLKLDNLAEMKVRLAAELNALKQGNAERRQQFTETMTAYQSQIAELEASIVRNDADATMDALTGLINRGAFDRTLKGLADMPDARFSLVRLDVDHLKNVNDEHGHLAGDRVLLAIAQALNAAVRGTDLVARYDGDEFAILMRDSPLRPCESRVYNAVSTITHGRLTADDGRAVQFTMSGGVAEFSLGDTAATVSERAAAALADAKRDGCNRIIARAVSPYSSTVGASRLRH
jgi:diguanylate cyclase